MHKSRSMFDFITFSTLILYRFPGNVKIFLAQGILIVQNLVYNKYIVKRDPWQPISKRLKLIENRFVQLLTSK